MQHFQTELDRDVFARFHYPFDVRDGTENNKEEVGLV